jgi:hypothetical protein
MNVIRSIPAVTERIPQCRIAAIPAASSHILITTPPWTKPAEFASWMLIQRISSDRESEALRGSCFAGMPRLAILRAKPE